MEKSTIKEINEVCDNNKKYLQRLKTAYAYAVLYAVDGMAE